MKEIEERILALKMSDNPDRQLIMKLQQKVDLIKLVNDVHAEWLMGTHFLSMGVPTKPLSFNEYIDYLSDKFTVIAKQ